MTTFLRIAYRAWVDAEAAWRANRTRELSHLADVAHGEMLRIAADLDPAVLTSGDALAWIEKRLAEHPQEEKVST